MLLLATDLDGTFLAGESEYKNQLYQLMHKRQDVLLVFITGRGLGSVTSLFTDPALPKPDYIICDVGATIVNGKTLNPVEPLQTAIEKKWTAQQEIYHQLKNVKGLRPQEVPQMRRCSFFSDEHTNMAEVHQIAASFQCDVIYSAQKFVDILPSGVNKGSSLKQLIKLLEIPAEKILVAGDTLNDLSLYYTGYKAVVVGSAEDKLVEMTKNLSHVYQAKRDGCGGILEAMDFFSFMLKKTDGF